MAGFIVQIHILIRIRGRRESPFRKKRIEKRETIKIKIEIRLKRE
jgi:hypothetical protein